LAVAGLAVLLPLTLFLGIALVLRGHGWAYAAIAAVLLALGAVGFAAWGCDRLAAEERAGAAALAKGLAAEAAVSRAALLAAGGDPAVLSPERWDLAERPAAAAAAARGWRAAAPRALAALAAFLVVGLVPPRRPLSRPPAA
jgi:hypothetical protein